MRAEPIRRNERSNPTNVAKRRLRFTVRALARAYAQKCIHSLIVVGNIADVRICKVRVRRCRTLCLSLKWVLRESHTWGQTSPITYYINYRMMFQ